MNRRKTETDSEGIIVKGYPLFGILGVIEFVFGWWITLSCLADSTEANPTGGIALCLFVLFVGSGLGFIGYSRRFIRLTDTDIQIRDFLSRTRSYRIDEIQEVCCGRLQICTAKGRDGVLFRLYDYSPVNPGHIFLLQELERRGIRVDVGARMFSTAHFSALHPDPDRRHFSVLLSSFPGRLGDRLTIDGRRLTLHRPFRRDAALRAGELGEGRLRQHRNGKLCLRLYRRDGSRFLELSRPHSPGSDLSIIALLIHLADCGVPLDGLEQLSEDMQAGLRSRYADPRSAAVLFGQEYARHLPLLKQYEAELKEAGLKLLYGPLDRNREGWPEQICLPPADWPDAYECGIFFCLLKNGRMVYSKREEAPLSAFLPVVLRAPLWVSNAFPEFRSGSQDQPALVFFQPFADSDLGNWLKLFRGLAAKGNILVHADEPPVDVQNGGTADPERGGNGF